jgi:hypothetical protein
MAPLSTRVLATALGISLAVNGCVTYMPLGSGITPDPATVRLSLTDAARSENIGSLGSQIVSLEGKVQATSDSNVTVVVNEVGRVAADNQTIAAQTVTVPLGFIDRVERKKILIGRSLLLTGAITGVAIWIGMQAGHGNVSYGRPATPPPPGQ